MRFIKRHLTALQGADLAGIRVHARDLMTEISQTGPSGQSDIAGSKDRNVHRSPILRPEGLLTDGTSDAGVPVVDLLVLDRRRRPERTGIPNTRILPARGAFFGLLWP